MERNAVPPGERPALGGRNRTGPFWYCQ